MLSDDHRRDNSFCRRTPHLAYVHRRSNSVCKTVEPRINEPLYNKVLGITNYILHSLLQAHFFGVLCKYLGGGAVICEPARRMGRLRRLANSGSAANQRRLDTVRKASWANYRFELSCNESLWCADLEQLQILRL